MMWRHGDVMIAQVEEVPQNARRLPNAVLAYGEVTGHSHRVEDPKTVASKTRKPWRCFRAAAKCS